MDATTLRAWWWHRQGLDGSLAGRTAAEVLEQAGWARSVGERQPLSHVVRARRAADAPRLTPRLAALEIHELPGARGCTYVVPAKDFALALTAGQAFGGGEMKVARKLGVTDKDVDKLCDKVVAVLAQGTARSRGAEGGRRAGREAPRRGRQEEGAHLDAARGPRSVAAGRPHPARAHQRPPRPAALQVHPVEAEPACEGGASADDASIELARRFFRWIGPARAADFQWFSGLGVKAAKAAMEPLRLVTIETGSDLLIAPEPTSSRFRRCQGAGQAAIRPGRLHRQHQLAKARPAEPDR